MILRYFDCRGRAQGLREALVDAGVAFTDERIAIGASWQALKNGPASGPFGSLPVLEYGGEVVAQVLPIAGYLARRLGHYDGLDAMGIARLEMIASAAYMDVTLEITTMIRTPLALSDADAARFANHASRVADKLARLERMLAATDAPFFGGAEPAIADFLVAEGIRMARFVITARVDEALERAPRLVASETALAQRPALLRYVADGKRPVRLTGSPQEREALEHIRRWDTPRA